METQVAKIDPKEYGIEEKDVATIEQAFMPKIVERDAMIEVYNGVINSELTPELSRTAKEVRLKLVKVRTGIAEIHKTQKAFYLAAGRYVDAWKNKETAPVEQMEQKLSEIETHFEKIEADRIAKIESMRKLELEKYEGFIPVGLGLMDEPVYQNHLNGVKLAHEAKIEAERKAEADRIEAERMVNQRRERELVLLQIDGVKRNPNMTFTLENKENTDFSNVIDVKDILDCDSIMFENYLAEFVATSESNVEYEKMVAAENERLKKEAEEKEKQLAAERAKAEAERKALEEKAQKEREIADAKLKAEQEAARVAAEKAAAERVKLEAELKAKQDAELKAELDKQAEIKRQSDEAVKLAKAPIKSQLHLWVGSFSLPESTIDNETKKDIVEKFNAFKNWATTQVEKL